MKDNRRNILNLCIARIVCIFIIALLAEVFLFNFRHWESLTFAKTKSYTISTGTGIKEEGTGLFSVSDNKDAFIEIDNINTHVGNIYLNLFDSTVTHTAGEAIPIQVYETDAANSTFQELPETEIVYGVPESNYITLHLVGNTPKLRVYLKNIENGTFSFNEIGINRQRPIIFRWWRFCGMILFIGIFMAFRSNSSLYKTTLNIHENRQKVLIGATIGINLCLIFLVFYIFYDRNWQNATWLASLQYNYLAHSLAKGHAWLDFDVPSALVNMKNPYDTALRTKILDTEGQKVITDFAYYNGRYYSYFGIVPVILFYLPYLLLTGHDLSTGKIICFICMVFTIVVFAFLYVLIKKYFKNISVGIYLLLSTTFITASGILYCVQMSNLYSLPIAMGITCDIAGLTCWLNASDGRGNISRLWLMAGSILMALVIGCRPQLCIAVFFAFVIFWNDIRNGRFFARRGVKNTLCVFIPFLMIGIGVMYYNYIRFDSPFNFGATYNLTGFDMTHRGFIFDRFWLGLYEYFIQPFNVGARFPYFSTAASHMGLATDFQGQTINEPLMAGYFAYNIIGLYILGLHRSNKELRRRGVLGFAVIALLSGIIIVGLDIQMVGITLRYLTDFSLFITLSAWIVILNGLDSKNVSLSRLKVVIGLSYFDLFINYFTLFADGRYNQARSAAPYVFYLIKYALSVR